MREALLAAMALIVIGAALDHWNGPQSGSGYSAASFSSPRRSNCPPPYWQSRRPVQAVHDDGDDAGQWERVEPEYPETQTQGSVTTVFRRAD